MDLLLKLQPVHLYQKVEDALLKIEQLHKPWTQLRRLWTKQYHLVASRRTDDMEIVVDP